MDEQGAIDRGGRSVAVIGSGVSGLSAAWLLSRRHTVTLFEKEGRLGGHSNTVDSPAGPVDTGFIVYNEVNYPNLVALFDHLGVVTRPTDMSFGVSIDGGRMEYAGNTLGTLLAQPTNLLKKRFRSMVGDILRFYREAPALLQRPDAEELTIGRYLDEQGYSDGFVRDHLLPMAAAIWSSPVHTMRDYPAASFIRFCENHGLLRLKNRPLWRTVEGGSRAYVRHLAKAPVSVRPGAVAVRRLGGKVHVRDARGEVGVFDDVVIAAHPDQALALLDEPTPLERRLLGAFAYQPNRAVLHTDPFLMPRRRKVWSAWNYLAWRGAREEDDALCVTYWMNALQTHLPKHTDLFVTLNPPRPIADARVIAAFDYDHPVFDAESVKAQRELWRLQGQGGVWYCGAWFGAGFHEDGLQSGLAVAEALGGVRRPWTVAGESARIHLGPGFGTAVRERVAA